jgi:hypoxanthine phosphoribosyltransferase
LSVTTSPSARPATVDLDQGHFASCCRALAERLAAYEPDLVVGIANGGSYVAREVARNIHTRPTIADVTLRRPATGFKERLQVGRLLRRLPPWTNDALRWLEVEARERCLRLKQGGADAAEPVPPSDAYAVPETARASRRIIVVDDTIDSGRTLMGAVALVRDRHPDASVRTAVLTSTWRNPPVRPDYCLFDRTLLRFPWSMDS